MVTGSPDVKLTPYIGAVVLKIDLHILAGVISLSGRHVWGCSSVAVMASSVVEDDSAKKENQEVKS